MKPPMALVVVLETAINQYLRLDPEMSARLDAFTGKLIGIELRGLDLTFFVTTENGGVRVLADCPAQPDAVLRGAPLSMLRAATSRDERALFDSGVEIEGDTELGRRFKYLLDAMDIDWEEHLAVIIGDVAAHQLGNAARGVMNWARKTRDSLSRDAAEYLQEESRDLPVRYEVEEFLDGVDSLRSDTDRLEQRIERLTRRATEASG